MPAAFRRPAASLAALVLLTGAVFLGVPACSKKSPTAAGVVPGSALRYLPRETVGLAVLEAARLSDRAAITRWLDESMAAAAREPGVAALRGILGSDFLQKVDRAAVALVPDGAGAATAGAGAPAGGPAAAGGGTLGRTPGWVVVLEGKFDPKTIKSVGPEGTLVTLFEVTGGPELSLISLPGGALALGPRTTLEKVKGTMGLAGAGFAQAGLLKALGKVAGDAQAWGAIDYPPLTELARGATGSASGDSGSNGGASGGAGMAGSLLASRASALQSVAFEARIASETDFTLVGVASDIEGAKRLGDAARGLVALARMAAGQETDKTFFDFLDGVRVLEDKSDVRLTGKMTQPMLTALLARAGDQFPGAGNGTGAP
ncbi:MAG TPA: hypothetical protein VJV75_07885, partial [Candidatus Polarisedimenticolia bacterium]|nr:hypothetical protein [Candidatus Polarisedimenticolia bacterium]